MRGIRFLGDKRSEVIDYPDEEPGPGLCFAEDAFVRDVRVRSASVPCAADQRKRRNAILCDRVHEPCGEVAVLGEGVEGLQIGGRILQHHYEGCGNCRMCREGWSQLCTGMERLTHGYGRHGGHGDYMIARADTCLTLPDELSYEGRRISSLRSQHSVSRTKEATTVRTSTRSRYSVPGLSVWLE